MKKIKKERLEKAGWKVGTVQEFLCLTDKEVGLIELKRIYSKRKKAFYRGGRT